MTAWQEYSAADFDGRLAPKGAVKRAREAAETGQAGLFFMPAPERETTPAKNAAREELAGQEAMFSAEP